MVDKERKRGGRGMEEEGLHLQEEKPWRKDNGKEEMRNKNGGI